MVTVTEKDRVERLRFNRRWHLIASGALGVTAALAIDDIVLPAILVLILLTVLCAVAALGLSSEIDERTLKERD